MKTDIKSFTKEHLFGLIAIVIALAGVICAFIGPFFTVEYAGVEKEASLAFLIGLNPAGGSMGALFAIVIVVLPVLSIVGIVLSWKKERLLVLPLIFLFFSAIVSLVLKDSLSEGYAAATDWADELAVTRSHFASIFSTVAFFLSAACALIAGARSEHFAVSDIVETGMLIAMALALNMIRLFRMPTGGSVNLQMLPLFILALRRGPLKGFIAGGIVYGLITCLTDGYGFATFPFDYLLGFGSVAIVGLFTPFILGKEQKGYNLKGLLFILLAGILSTFVRFVAGTVSSMVIYNYTLGPAMLYNVGYVFISGAISTAVVMMLYKPLIYINNHFPSYNEKIAETE